MKKICGLVLFSMISFNSFAQSPTFTAIGTSGKNVLAGVKVVKKDHEPETYLKLIAADFKASTVSLPEELSHREVIAVLPARGNDFLVITQRTVEQGDKPQVHRYASGSKKWSKLGEIDCPSFEKLTVGKNTLSVSCVETDESGKEKETEKKLTSAQIDAQKSISLTLPETRSESESLKVELVGPSFEWDQLKVSSGKVEKVFRP